MREDNDLRQFLGIRFQVIMAPMFLVSNLPMIGAAMRSGIMGVFPTLNFRKAGELESVLDSLAQEKSNTAVTGDFGVNLIVQKTNPYLERHLGVCADKKVPFYITSLGNPRPVIDAARSYGAKVFCDVTNLKHAEKCAAEGCDGFIAVGQGAGGHAGPHPLQVLIPALKRDFPNQFVIAAGGIATGAGLLSAEVLGADGASIGTLFITSKESTVSRQYKAAVLQAGLDDIVLTSRLSGTPCTIIDTPEAKKMGYSQSWFERVMSNNPRTKKWFKMFLQARGMKKLEASVLPNNYTRLWCAGKSSELIEREQDCAEIVTRLEREYREAIGKIRQSAT